MSHFTVLVITDSAEQLKDALAPFQENNMGDCPEEYLKFQDCTEEVISGWGKDTIECYTLPDGTKFPRYRSLPEPYTDLDVTVMEAEDIPVSQYYDSRDKYAEDYHGYTIHPETGAYGYWENQNAKWDWWVLGGRWTGFFKMKPGAEFEVGDPGVFGNQARRGYADQAKKGDIDFEGMLADAERDAHETFDKVEAAIAGIPGKPETWKTFREKFHDIEVARMAFNKNSFVEALSKADLGSWFGCSIEEYHLHEPDSRQRYVNDRRCGAFSTFAVLYEGVWYERGEMGRFGFGVNEKSRYDWGAQFMDIIDNLPDTAVLSLVDCHI